MFVLASIVKALPRRFIIMLCVAAALLDIGKDVGWGYAWTEIKHLRMRRVKFDRDVATYLTIKSWGHINSTFWLGWKRDWIFGVRQEYKADSGMSMYELCGASGKEIPWGNKMPADWFKEVHVLVYLVDRYTGEVYD